jgi:hypothetical protein
LPRASSAAIAADSFGSSRSSRIFVFSAGSATRGPVSDIVIERASSPSPCFSPWSRIMRSQVDSMN